MFNYREAREGDASSLADRLRHADKLELIATNGDVLKALQESIAATPQAQVAYLSDPNVPEAVFGVAPDQRLGHLVGIPWFLGTDEIERRPTFFIRESRRIASEWDRAYGYLVNWVDSRNEKRLQWLRWLGFQFGPSRNFGPDQVPFFQFYKVNNVRSS